MSRCIGAAGDTLTTMFARRHWIPPAALLYGHVAHAFSWLLLLWAVWSASRQPYVGFAWIHAVALGWVTMAALAILVHAIPNFVDVRWRGETLTRWALVAYGAGVALLLYGFLADARFLATAADLLLAALLLYAGCAFVTLAAAMRGQRVQRAVARAFAGTLVFLLVTGFIGFALASLLAGRGFAWAASLASAHAALGTLGWLSLLIFGVSMRTFRPMTGVATRFRWMHIVVGALAVLGTALLAAGLASHEGALASSGGGVFAIAALGYALDTFDILRRATVRHRPPQAFIAAAVLWFLSALALGGGVLAGKPWRAAYIFVLLIGWVGQMVVAHFHHIGVRLISTIYRGEEDETRPELLLELRLSWLTFAGFQIAVALCAAGLIAYRPNVVARGCVFGILAWVAMSVNMLAARARARAGSSVS